MTNELTREDLIRLCTHAAVQVSEWRNRDTADAQKQVGEALALLRAGAEWRLARDPEQTETTHWIYISYPGFNAFEVGVSKRSAWEEDLFYIPTAERLERSNGRDWY